MAIFEKLCLWMDAVPRSGPEAMAVDEWLLESAQMPILRVYSWLGEWGSIGYFGKLSQAMDSFPEISWVRRWTGGGTVDHRADWTYTLVAPSGEALVGLRGAESYRVIHAAVVETLRAEGIDARLSHGAEETGASLCFENPVSHDILGPTGRKLAGAGQRRTRLGLLHQGSIALACNADVSAKRASCLATVLAKTCQNDVFYPPQNILNQKVTEKYSNHRWTQRR